MQTQPTEAKPNGATAKAYDGWTQIILRESVTFDNNEFSSLAVPHNVDSIFAVRLTGRGSMVEIGPSESYDGFRISRRARRPGATTVATAFIPREMVKVAV